MQATAIRSETTIHARAEVAVGDVATLAAVLKWLKIRGASIHRVDANLVEKPRVMLLAMECRRLIAEIKYEFAADITGHSFGSHGRQSHWQAEILGAWVQWVEDGRL